MREIKFRGRDISTGEYCYGYFRQHETEIYPRAVIYCADDRFRIVDPDSVAQLVGYDANGKEVYEGDTVVDKHRRTTVVDYRDNPEFVALHTLEEAD